MNGFDLLCNIMQVATCSWVVIRQNNHSCCCTPSQRKCILINNTWDERCRQLRWATVLTFGKRWLSPVAAATHTAHSQTFKNAKHCITSAPWLGPSFQKMACVRVFFNYYLNKFTWLGQYVNNSWYGAKVRGVSEDSPFSFPALRLCWFICLKLECLDSTAETLKPLDNTLGLWWRQRDF